MRLLKPLIVLAFFAWQPCSSQDWKTLYEQSKKAYDGEQYAMALADAEKALDLVKNTDPKTTAYTLQLLTAICLDGQITDKGLVFSNEEVKTFADLEGASSKHYFEAVRKQSKLLQQAGQLQPAAEKNVLLINLAGKIFGSESYDYYSSCFSYAQLLMELNLFTQSQEMWNKCLPNLKVFPQASEDYFYGLFYSGVADYKASTWQEASRKLQEFISIADQNSLQELDEYKQAKLFLDELLNKEPGANTSASSDGKSLQPQLAAALAYQNKKQWDLALQEYAQAEKSITPENAYNNTTFSYYLNYGKLLFQSKQYDKAWLQLNEAKKIAAKLFFPTSAEHGYTQYLEAELKLASDNRGEAQRLYLSAITNLKSLAWEVQSTYLLNASRAMLTADQPQFSLDLMQPLLATTGIPGSDDRHQLDFISTYCDALEALNQNSKASDYLKEKIVLAHPGVKIPLQIRQAEVLKASGHWQEAIVLLQDVLKSPALTPEMKAEAIYQLARTQQLLGRYPEAEANYLSALALHTQLRSSTVEQVNNSLATFYIQLGNFEAAEDIYVNALKSSSADPGFTNTLKQNLASVFQQTKRQEDARKLLEEVVQSEKKSTGAGSVAYSVSLQNLAALYQQQGNYEKAKTLYLEALDIDKKFLGEQDLNYATKMANLATAYQETGELEKAKSLFESALHIREAKLGIDHPDFVFNQYNLAVLYERMQLHPQALPLYKRVAAFYVQHIRDLFPAMSEQEKSAFYNKIQGVINAYQDFAIEHASLDKSLISELFDFRLQTKALLLNSSTVIRNRILSSGSPDLIAKFTNWLQTKEQLALLYSLPADERLIRKAQAEGLQQKANSLEKELSSQSELFASATKKSPATWRQIQSALKPGEAVVEMIRLRLNLKNDSVIYAALIVKPGLQSPSMAIMPQGRRMEKREFSYYRNSIRFRILNERSYQVFWKPLESNLSDVQTVYFSADGIYNKINPQTLYDPEKKQYLIDRYSVKLISNPKELLVNPSPLLPTPVAVLIGFPDYLQDAKQDRALLATSAKNTSSAAFELVRGGIEALPGTKDEVLKIEKLLQSHQWNATSYLFDKATEEMVKAQRSPALLHIATHGFFIPESPENSPMSYGGQGITQAEVNPLLRSGLMLAGAEKNLVNQFLGKTRALNTEDGVLTALEAMNMNLKDTDLVVLSACETGAGEVRNGEGVYGLQRSFLVAGANSVMMSLWKVSDEATQELMVLFYRHWLTLKDKRKAFHETQLELKKTYADPFYWGAFVMTGK